VKLQESTRQCDDLRASGTKTKRKSISKTQKSIPVSAAVEVSPVVLQNTLKELDKKPKPLIPLTELATPINADRHDLPHTPRSSTAPARARNSQSPARTGDRSGSDVSRACETHTRNGFEEIGKHDNTMIAMKSYNRAVASREAEVEEASRVNPSTAQDEQHAAYLQYEIQSTRQSEEYRRLALEGQGCGYGTGDNSSVGSVKSSVTTPSECNSSSIVGAPKTRSTTPVQQKVLRRKTLWAEYLDPASGLQYYHNRLTKETTWDMPSPNEMLQLLPLI
jgi:WW domain